jgi:hypothetical protein
MVHLKDMFQVKRKAPVEEVVVTGSGAGGGTVAYGLANPGIHAALPGAAQVLHLSSLKPLRSFPILRRIRRSSSSHWRGAPRCIWPKR